MKRKLRHPIRSITEPFGKAGLIVAILALVLAMVGGAYAAGKLTAGQKKEVEKIAKKFAGKPGAPGATGLQGTPGVPGSQGKEGPEGKQGEKGEEGAKGTTGANGKSVTVSTTSGCPEGGITVEAEGGGSKGEVCNGKEGEEGQPGQPWTPNGTLPAGATETGFVAAGSVGPAASPPEFVFLHEALVSIPISLATPIEGQFNALSGGNHGNFDYAGTGESGGGKPCEGTFYEPKAAHGFFCLYGHSGEVGTIIAVAPEIANGGEPVVLQSGTALGVVVKLEGSESGPEFFSWAVTG